MAWKHVEKSLDSSGSSTTSIFPLTLNSNIQEPKGPNTVPLRPLTPATVPPTTYWGLVNGMARMAP
jgi:hypothetical protein